MKKVNLTWTAQLITILLSSAALKFHYSTASVNQLRWILAPTTLLVELVSGERFQFESHAGYMNSDHTFLIAASCAGVNFLLTAFLMLALGHLWRCRSQTVGWRFIPALAGLAYAATLVANTVRIATALRLHRLPAQISWLSPEQLHRFEGIFIYFGFLLLLFTFTDKISQRNGARDERMSLSLCRRSIFPLLVYYATTLGMPLANGAYRQGAEFWEHALFVLFIPLVFILPLVTVRFLRVHRRQVIGNLVPATQTQSEAT
jgi:exosortase K